jgi:hypothetical protein
MPRRTPPFRPRFTLMLVYLAALFVLYGLLFAAADLAPIASEAGRLPPDELHARAREAAQHAMRGKAPIALAAALLTLGLAAWRKILPGLR